MNRHHPYGGYEDGSRRRSASPPYRGGGGAYRGRGAKPPRGRGAGGGYNAAGRGAGQPAYDAYGSHPAQAAYGVPLPPYTATIPIGSDYSNPYGSAGHMQRDPFYANGDVPAANYPDYSYGGTNDYDGSGASPRGAGHDDRGRGRGGLRGGRPRHRDDKVHDSIIEERINRERPCRTLFIRNIKYESSSEEMRAAFEAHGEIKTFFDLIKTRGMVFVTYFDLRAAQRAKERLQGMDVSGRAIDVHYSLPREHELSQRCDREKNQGTVLATLVDSRSQQPIDEMELRRRMAQWGEIKHIKPLYVAGIMRADQRLVEFYDSRACILAYDRLRDQHMQDGMLDLQFEWDVPEQPLPDGPVPIPIGSSVAGSGGRRSPAYGDRGGYRGGTGGDGLPANEWDRPRDNGPAAAFRDDYAGGRRDYPPASDYRVADPRDNRRASGGFPPASPIAERAVAPYGGAPHSGDYRDRSRDNRGGPGERDFDRDPRGYSGAGPDRRASKDEWRGGRPASPPLRARVPPAPGTDEFGRALPPGRPEASPVTASAPMPAYPSYGGAATTTTALPAQASAPQSLDDRLEQAKRVQQILAALKPGGASTAATTPSAPAPAPPVQAPSSYYGVPPSQATYPSTGQYQANYPPQGLPANPMSSYPPPTGQTQTAPPTQASSVQNLLALLAQNQQKH